MPLGDGRITLPSPINDYLATFALKNVDKIMKRNLSIARENLEIFMKWLGEHRDYFDYVKPKAGVLLFTRINKIPVLTEELCKGLYEKHKLLMVPRECFEMPGFLRIGFGNDSEMFKAGCPYFWLI